MPVFNKQFYSDTVPENIELHSPLSVAIQAESPLGRKLIYSIVKGNELEEFAVDFNTGKYMFLFPTIKYYKVYRTKDSYFVLLKVLLCVYKRINNLLLVSINIIMEAIYAVEYHFIFKIGFQSNMMLQYMRKTAFVCLSTVESKMKILLSFQIKLLL